jgi:hypothetical protein
MGRTAVPVDYEKNPAATFQNLMQRWDAAIATYNAAIDARETLAQAPELAAERLAAERRALAELSDVKVQISQLVAESYQTRRRFRPVRLLSSLRLVLPQRWMRTNGEPKPRTLSRT